MRIITLALFFILTCTIVTAQEISYTIPEGYEKNISPENYKALVDLAVPMVKKHFTIEQVKDGVIQLKPGQSIQTINLHNIILKCAAEKDRTAWNEIVEGHLNNIFASADAEKEIDYLNYESIKKHLCLRIYPQEAIAHRGGIAALVSRTDMEGTYTVLMLDLPGTFIPVQKKFFDAWKKEAPEVFAAAQHNINQQKVEKATQQFETDGGHIEISFLGNEDYAASYALDLPTNAPEMIGEWGTVLAIPNKGIVDLCKVSHDKPLDFVKFIEKTLPHVKQSYSEHPQPVSDQYFWYYKGKFTRINITTGPNGQPNIIAPVGLSELMTAR